MIRTHLESVIPDLIGDSVNEQIRDPIREICTMPKPENSGAAPDIHSAAAGLLSNGLLDKLVEFWTTVLEQSPEAIWQMLTITQLGQLTEHLRAIECLLIVCAT